MSPLTEEFNKYGLKATFNINSKLYGKGGESFPKGQFGRLSLDEVREVYKNGGHEIALHTLHHKLLPGMNPIEALQEIYEDKRLLEEQFGIIVRGMAYPMGAVSTEIEDIARTCGIAYARTSNHTKAFWLPENEMRVLATCHHNLPELMKLADTFINRKYICPELFLLRGHSYEFETDDNWEVLESFCEKVSGKDDIWYATCIDIFDYHTAYKKLQYSANIDRIHNPSAIPVYVQVNCSKNIVIEGGKTVEIL